MNIINVENITKSYTERELFHEASFYLQEGEKVGIIGINGTGKTTLLRMILSRRPGSFPVDSERDWHWWQRFWYPVMCSY